MILKDFGRELFGFEFCGIQVLFAGTVFLRLSARRALKRVNIKKMSSVPKLILNSTAVVSARISRWLRKTITVLEAMKDHFNSKKRHR